MREVVVTGYGIVSSLGNDVEAVTESLKNSTSGISINEVNKELGLRSYISGSIKNLDLKEEIDRRYGEDFVESEPVVSPQCLLECVYLYEVFNNY